MITFTTFIKSWNENSITLISVPYPLLLRTMCGIFGIINKDGSLIDEDLLKIATRQLKHRGPDGEGFYSKSNIGLGHQRLSIIDLSENASQPYRKHKMVLSYNGEIYNFSEIKLELEKEGIVFLSQSDTEVFLSAYYHWGEDAFDKFNGMWAALIWNESEKELVISRDRYGMKPLFIFECENSIAFASEIKAFSVLQNWTGELNETNVYDFLASGLLNHNQDTFYKNVRTLEVACSEKYSYLGSLCGRQQYYEIDLLPSQDRFSPLEYRSYFSNAVASHFVADVEVVAALSGGMDSSSIVAVSDYQGRSIETFTYAASDPAYSEFKYVELLKEKTDFKSHSISPSFEDHLKAHKFALIANEAPCLAINLVSSYLLYKEVASKNFKVLLAGQGADELLLGYSFYYVPFLRYLAKRRPILFLKEACALLIRYPKESLKSVTKAFKGIEFNRFINDQVGRKEERVTSTFEESYKYYLGFGQLYGLLQYEDRLSMAHGVEARLPFLDVDFSNYAHGIPFHQKIVDALRKMPLRKAMKGIVPSDILNRRDKMGYLTPEEKWIKENEAYFKERILQGVKKHSKWFTSELNNFLDRAFQDKSNYGFIWRVYSFLEFLEVKL